MTVSTYKELTRPALSGQVQYHGWTYQGQTVTIVYETLGVGPTVLLLPALSTVLTRLELAQIAQALASQFRVIALDWLGFGDSDRPTCTYERSLYQALIADFVQNCCPQPAGILAAGHGAGYALHPSLRLKCRHCQHSLTFMPSICLARWDYTKNMALRWVRSHLPTFNHRQTHLKETIHDNQRNLQHRTRDRFNRIPRRR